MQYDIALKELLRHCHAAILEDLIGLPVTTSTLIEEKPRETTSVRRSDFVLRVVQADGEELLVLIEFQTHWDRRMPQRMLEYRARYVARMDLDAITVLMLTLPSPSATEEYRDREVHYRYRLVKLYELDAATFIQERKLCLLPLTPLMRDGVALAKEADRLIVESDLPEVTKADMLTTMTLLAGLVSEDLAYHLIERRRDMMMQSIGYELIKKEGLEEGLKKGYKKGLQEGIALGRKEGIALGREEGLALGREEGLAEGILRGREEGREEGYRQGVLEAIALGLELKFGVEGLKLMPEIEAITDIGILRILEKALRSAQNVEEFRSLYQD